MVRHNQSPTPHQRSAKFRAKPLKGPSSEVADFGEESDVKISCTDNKHVNKKSNAQPSQMLSRAELISAVGQIWDCASRSLTRSQPRADPNCSDSVSQKGNKTCYLVDAENIVALEGIDSECLHVQLNSRIYFPSIVHQSLECMRMTQKLQYRPCEDHYIKNFLREICGDISGKNYTWSKEKSLADVGIPYGLMNRNEVCCPLSEKEEIVSSNSGIKKFGLCIDTFTIDRSSSGRCLDIKDMKSFMPSLYSDYFLQVVRNKHHASSISSVVHLEMKSYPSISEPSGSHEANHEQSEADDLVDDVTTLFEEVNIQGEIQSKCSSPVTNKPHTLLAKQEHAVSGALSGIVVSLCLHPVDTVKTVLQSCQAGQKSLFYIGQSLITERGLSGLYRGISSNITASAPISALYTFTYESVKGLMLPSLSKEYYSIAHCIAGGCASIATSFIFTPSDHIKQQMQVNSKYQNCWTAALRIIEKGGLLSLYAGWGAVLCRNIPHSIIKFYTYESLKQMFVSFEMPNNQPTTSQTLLCGGLAGSAAALFSTPFDVVKTRLQTQMPGSARKYQNILNTLQLISSHEGVKGLYRGLIPRLVIYMSQGALFFASYEFFQSLLSLDLRQDA